jgi:sugar lactone lactonase YvrE
VTTKVLLDGLILPEGPRWHDDRLWFSDLYGHRVATVGLDGKSETILEVDDRPSGLGFLPDSSLIVVLMDQRRLLRINNGAITTHADLTSLGGVMINDMVIGPSGRAYVGHNFSRVNKAPTEDVGDCIVLVETDGTCRIAAQGGLFRPNGVGLTADGKTLVVNEFSARRIAEFAVNEDGGLSHAARFADLGNTMPDGLCLDSEGAVWIATFDESEFRRVYRGGLIADTIKVPGKWAVACVLGGSDRKTLFMSTVIPPPKPDTGPGGNLGDCMGFIETATVAVPGAGWP